VTRIAKNTAALLGTAVSDSAVELDARYHAGIYGIPDDQTIEAMKLAARLEAMITDPVYEGKSMAGLIDLVATGEIGSDSTVLYAHLGGQPALNAYSSLTFS
jgi:1-aminocyclopropane-1-carboxylate deaminase